MGIGALTERVSAETITTDVINQLRAAMLVDWIPRNLNGVPTDLGGDLGTEDFQWRRIRGQQIFINGEPLDTAGLTGRRWRVESGKAKASGYPDYLTPAGVGNGLIVTVDATSDDFDALADGVSIKLTSNLVISSLFAAPAANNTCDINDTSLAGGDETEILGELDSKAIAVDAIGTEITALDGKVAAFLTPTSEIILARVDTTNNRVFPLVRGWAGTDRGALSNNDTLTLLQLNTLLLNEDGFTNVKSVEYPESVGIAPGAGSAGKVYIERTTGAHKYDDGSDVVQDYVIIGFAVCDDSDCIAVQPADFDLQWVDRIAFNYQITDVLEVKVQRGAAAGVKGVTAEFFDDITVDISANLEAGEVLTANKELFIYLAEPGTLVFSHKPPRKYDFLRKGLYHVSEYWRAVGSIALNASAECAFKRRENRNVESMADSLVPVGTVIAMNGAYFTNGSNAGAAPLIGSSAAQLNARLPANWRVCDGSELYDPESPIFNAASRFLPNLTDDRFIRGNTAIGNTGGGTASLTTANLPAHTHSIDHGHSISGAAGAGHVHAGQGSLAAHVRWPTADDQVQYDERSATWTADSAIEYTAGATPVTFGAAAPSNPNHSFGVVVSGNTATESGGSTPAVASHSGNSGSTGSGTSFNVVPKFLSHIYLMRVK